MIQNYFRQSIVLLLLYFPSYAAQTDGLRIIAHSHKHMHDIATTHQQAVFKTLIVERAQGAHTTGQLLSKCTKDSCKKQPNKTSVWLQPLGLSIRQNNRGSAPGSKSRTGTFLIGMDSKIKDGLILGGALGYGHGIIDFNLNAGKSRVHDTFLTLFGTWFQDIWYVEGSFLGGFQKYRVTRNTGTNNIFSSNEHGGYQVCPHLGGGYIFPLKGYKIRPYATADYAYSYQAGHLNKGPGAPDIYIDHSESSMLRLETGFNLSKKYDYEEFYSKFFLQLSAVHKQPLKRGFIIASNGTSYQSSRRATTAFSPGLNASVFFNDGYSLSAFWIGEYASQYTQQEVFLKFRKTL